MRVRSEPQFPAGVAVGVALVAGVMAALAVIRWNVWSYGTDTGTFAQIALNAFAGFADGPEGGTHFAFHWSPILAVLYPVVMLTRSPLSIQIVQVVLIAASAIPLFAIVRAYAGTDWGVRCSILALIYPPLLSIAFEEFHELAFYPVVLLALFWAADRARWIWFFVFSLFAVVIREDACVDLIITGVVFAAIGAMRQNTLERGLLAGEPLEPERLTVAGVWLTLLAAGSLGIYSYIVVPHVGRWAPTHFYDYPFAHGPVQVALAIFTHPLELVAATFTFGRLTYLLEAFAPLAFMPLFTRWTLLSIPGFAGVLLASDSIVWRMGFHYSLLWTPWLLLAAAWVLCKAGGSLDEVPALRWWGTAVGICAIVLIAFNPMHPAHYLRRAPETNPADIARAFACVPRTAPVMTHDEWFAHIALMYPNSTILDERAAQFRGYIVYSSKWPNAHVQRVILPEIARALAAGAFRTACSYGDAAAIVSTAFRTGE